MGPRRPLDRQPRRQHLTGIPKPRVLAVHEWPADDWRLQRAELLTLLPGTSWSTTDALRRDVNPPDTWWQGLRHVLNRLRSVPTPRIHLTPERVTERIQRAFDTDLRPDVHEWGTVHGDLHWANLLGPDLAILDWELWGHGPAHLDAATLYCHSLLTPNSARKIHDVFADQLDTPPATSPSSTAPPASSTEPTTATTPTSPPRAHAQPLLAQLR